MDKPNSRKIHLANTPSLGGVPIGFAAAFSLLVWMPSYESRSLRYFFASLVIVFIIGLRDDLIPLRPIFKLFSQIIPVIIVVYLTDIRFTSLYGLIDYNFPAMVSWGLSAFFLVALTNSFNLIDGIDGLAGTISAIALTALACWFYAIDEQGISMICFAFLGGLIAFLIFNWAPSQIFMGDTGALLLGFLISCLIVHFLNANESLSSSSLFKLNAPIATAISIVLIPFIDTLRVFVIRVTKFTSPFNADNNHLHHLLVKGGLGHSISTVTLALINIIAIATTFVMKDYPDTVMLPIVFLIGGITILICIGISKTKAQKTTV